MFDIKKLVDTLPQESKETFRKIFDEVSDEIWSREMMAIISEMMESEEPIQIPDDMDYDLAAEAHS